MDIKDIMGIKGDTKGAAKKTKGVSGEEARGRESRGVADHQEAERRTRSRRWSRLGAGLKDKRKVSARNVAWSWQPFKNSARSIDLMLKHWVKTGASGQMLPGLQRRGRRRRLRLQQVQQAVDMLAYNDEEYENLLQFDEEWTREETDHLFDLLQRFDLRFLIAKDRWEREKPRTVEEMKSRYYAVARRLVEARADDPEEAATHPIIRDPFDAQHEMDRKQALSDQMERTNALEREEQASSTR